MLPIKKQANVLTEANSFMKNIEVSYFRKVTALSMNVFRFSGELAISEYF